MDTADNIAAAVWAHITRTLSAGTPPTPTTQLELIVDAIWSNPTRTLTGSFAPTQWYPTLVDSIKANKTPVPYG